MNCRKKIFSALILACSLAGILSSFACNTVHGWEKILSVAAKKLRMLRIE